MEGNKNRKLGNLLFFDKENINDIKNDFENELKKINDLRINTIGNINPNLDVSNKTIKILTLPKSKFNFISENLAKGYSNLQNCKNFNQIKRIFLLAHPFKSKVNKIYLSCYDSYESHFGKKFEIDKQIYEELREDPQNAIKQNIVQYQQNTYHVTTFQEDNTNNRMNILENVETVNESEEDYDFSFDLHLDYLSLLFIGEDVKIVPIWFKTNLKEGSKDKIVHYLNNFFIKHLSNSENILICSTNLTYFGRNYNYFGNEKDFKTRSFLRNKENEEKIIKHVKGLDEEAISFFRNLDEKNFYKIKNLNFSKDLFLVLLKISDGLKLQINYFGHLCLKFDNIDPSDYELNFCTLANFIGLSQ